jgi:hypothetical protein
VAWRQDIEVHQFHALQGVDPVLDVGVGKVAEGHRLHREEIDGEEHSFLREAHDNGIIGMVAAHVGKLQHRAAEFDRHLIREGNLGYRRPWAKVRGARRIMSNEALPTPSTNRFLSICAPVSPSLDEPIFTRPFEVRCSTDIEKPCMRVLCHALKP